VRRQFESVRTRDGVSIRGDLDLADADDFVDAVYREAIQARDARFVIDLSGVTFMDSTGLHALVRVIERCRDTDLVIIPSRRVYTLLHLVGLTDRAWDNVVLSPPPGEGPADTTAI
jgi:anti-anti-sigma factor